LQNFISYYETQQLILGTGTAIWWVTEPHCDCIKDIQHTTKALGVFMLMCHYTLSHFLIVVLNVVILNFIILNVVMLNAIMLNVVMLNVIMLSVVAPTKESLKFQVGL
jgi:hypothetical protein